jgi:hypothetical protein
MAGELGDLPQLHGIFASEANGQPCEFTATSMGALKQGKGSGSKETEQYGEDTENITSIAGGKHRTARYPCC